MSGDLAKAFFERDLTEAEEQALADEIAASPETALRLAHEARSAYMATGLPVPDWGSSLAGASGAAAGGAALLKGLLVGALLTGAAWYWTTRTSVDPEPIPVPEPVPSSAPAVPSRPGKVSKAPPVAKKVARPAPTLAPQPYVPNRRYEGLAAIVRQESSGLVTVRILNDHGAEVRLLYVGMLPRGVWTFEWDGHLQDGTLAPEGEYKVETQSGRTLLQKRVLIDRP